MPGRRLMHDALFQKAPKNKAMNAFPAFFQKVPKNKAINAFPAPFQKTPKNKAMNAFPAIIIPYEDTDRGP